MADETYSIDIDVDSREVKKATRELQRFEKRIKRMTSQTERLRRATQKSSNRLAIFNAKLAATARNNRPLARMASGFASIGKSAGLAAVQIAAVGVAVSIGAVAMFAKGVVGAKEFNIANKVAFASLLGGAEAGKEAMSRSAELADTFGFKLQNVTGSMKKLLAAQFTLGESETFIKMGADLRAIGTDAEGVKGAIRAITQIKAKGRLQADELLQLSEANISQELIFDELQKSLGLGDTDAVRKAIEAGEVKSGEALKAILGAVGKKTGSKEAGIAGKKFADVSLEAAQNRIANAGFNVFRDVAEISPGTFDALGGIGKDLSKFFNDLSRGDLGDIFATAIVALRTLTNVGKAFISGFVGEMADGGDTTRSFFDVLSDPAVLEGIVKMGVGMASLVGFVLRFSAAVTTAASVIVTGFSTMFDFGTDLVAFLLKLFIDDIQAAIGEGLAFILGMVSQFVQLGADLIGGVAQGIRNGLGSVLGAVGSVASGAVSRFKSILGIASPSKVFAGLAGDVLDGFDKGLQTPSQKAATGGAVGSDSGGGGLGTTNNFNMGGMSVNTEVNEASDGPAIAAQMESSAMGIFGQAFEKMALAGGTA